MSKKITDLEKQNIEFILKGSADRKTLIDHIKKQNKKIAELENKISKLLTKQ